MGLHWGGNLANDQLDPLLPAALADAHRAAWFTAAAHVTAGATRAG